MNLVIFGSTGTIGKHLVQQALDLNHRVTAFTRSPEKLYDLRASKLTITTGDVLDSISVTQAVRGHDIVLIALGAGRKGRVRFEGTRNIVSAMEEVGVKRLICQSTLGAGDSWENLNFFWKRIMFGWFLKEAFEDHERQEEIVRKSNLDWTIVRPGAFTDGNLTGGYKHGFPPQDRSVKLKISRADVALFMFMLMQISTSQYLRKTPALSY